MLSEVLLLLSSGILGVFLGTQITEAFLFVPYWESLSADEFFNLHKVHGKNIHRFFAPITILATLIPLASVCCIIVIDDKFLLPCIMGFSTLAFFSTYFLFFKKANKRFIEGNISTEKLPKELKKWSNWHWGRVCFEFIAFVCSLLLLLIKL